MPIDPPSPRLAGRLALITGASRGLGRAIAERFAAEGADLILVARTTGGLEETDDACRAASGKSSLLVPLDLKDGAAIDRLGAALNERFGRLDILIGNAGILGELSPLAHIAPDLWADVMATDLTANWRLIRSLDPLLRRSASGQVVFVTSAASAAPRAYWGAYAIAKAGLDMLAGIYAEETRQSSVRVNLIDPGKLRTAMRAKAYPGEPKTAQTDPAAIADLFVDLAAAENRRHGERVKAQ